MTALTDTEARVYLDSFLGESLVRTISRTKYVARVLIKSSEGGEQIREISLPCKL